MTADSADPSHCGLEELSRHLNGSDDQARAARDELLQRGEQTIREIIASMFATSGFDAEELFRAGYLGLLNAVHNHELSRGRTFSEYAENLIRGEIRDHIRGRCRRAGIPQWMQDLNHQIELAQGRLLRESGQLPSLAELAETVNITEEGLTEILKARGALSYISLNAAHRANDPSPRIHLERIRSQRPSPFPIEQRIRLASALERLADVQQDLLHSLFRSDR